MFDLLIATVAAVPLAWVITLAGVVVSLAIIGWARATRPRSSKWFDVVSIYPQEIRDASCIERGHDELPIDGVFRPVCARCGRVVR